MLLIRQRKHASNPPHVKQATTPKKVFLLLYCVACGVRRVWALQLVSIASIPACLLCCVRGARGVILAPGRC